MNESYQKAAKKQLSFLFRALCLSINYVFITLWTFVIWKTHLVNASVCCDIACSCQGIGNALIALVHFSTFQVMPRIRSPSL